MLSNCRSSKGKKPHKSFSSCHVFLYTANMDKEKQLSLCFPIFTEKAKRLQFGWDLYMRGVWSLQSRIVWTLTDSTLCVSVLRRTFRSRHLMILKHALCSDTQSSPCPLQWNYCLYQNVITVIVCLLCTVPQQEEMSASQFLGCLQMAAYRLELSVWIV